LRDRGAFPQATETSKVPVVIVGGGIAGLSAAWQLDRSGFQEFVLLEMEEKAGGNSRSGENAISRYPWAAHYVPVPKPESVLVRELFTEFGILQDGQWAEEKLCFSPKERLFVEGQWQEGLEPHSVLTGADRQEFRRFEARISELRQTGAFTIPMEIGTSTHWIALRFQTGFSRKTSNQPTCTGWRIIPAVMITVHRRAKLPPGRVCIILLPGRKKIPDPSPCRKETAGLPGG
jgi:phytoene dehydrogenase-like protein